MLQFITAPSERFSVAEEAQMVIEGGGRWIELCISGMTDDEARDTALDVIQVCKENNAFMILADHVELARELGVHGVHLSDCRRDHIIATRELLGPEAVIGASVDGAAAITALNGVDVDYVTLRPDLSPEECRSIVDAARAGGSGLPIVASGDITADRLREIMSSGVSGVAMSRAIIDAEDPVAYTEKCLALLESK